MTAFVIDTVSIEVESYTRDSEGEITAWAISIGGVRLPDSADFLSPYVIADLEKQLKKHDDEEDKLAREFAAECLAEVA